MKTSVESLEPTRAKMTVTVPYEELAPSIDKAYKEVAQQVNVPGFRKGKVPARIIDQRIGRGVVIEQAVNSSLNDIYQRALSEAEVQPMGQPEVEVTQLPNVTGEAGGDLIFTAELDVRPEFDLPDLEGLELTVSSTEVSEEDVDKGMEELRQRFGSLVGVDRAAQDGDFVTLDLSAMVDEEEVDNASGVSYEIGSGTMLEGMDEALTGLSAGESTTFTTTLAGGDHEGQEAEVTVTPSAVKERELPDVDDEFAQLASEFDTVDELRADLREKAGESSAGDQAAEARDKLLDHLRENTDFPVPEGAIEAEITRHLEAESKQPGDPHGDEIRPDVTDLMRDQLILDALVDQHSINVTQDELLQFLVTQAQSYGMDPNQFIQAAAQTEQLPAFMGEVARNKALAVALRDIVIKDEAGEMLDLTEFIGSAETDAEDEAVSAGPEGAEEAGSADFADSGDSGDSPASADSAESAGSPASPESADSADAAEDTK